MIVDDGHLPYAGGYTWYQVIRADDTSLDAPGTRPLITLHGGPGAAHDYLESLADLVDPHRPVVFYDQFGCGRSTHRPEAAADSWTVEFFLDELSALLAHLEVDAGYDVLGQSWGGMLAAEHAVRRPPGLRRLVIANSPASMPMWRAAALELRAELPAETQATLDAHEADGTIRAPEYVAATEEFYRRHVIRVDPMPEPVARTFAQLEDDPTVYEAMNGPTEFHVVGSLREWTIIDRLPVVEVPTLVVHGRHDEATDEVVAPYLEHVAGVRGHTFPDSSHMPHWEERADYMALVGAFLDEGRPQ